MRVLVTGHDGYLGAVMLPLLQKAGHHVVGVDTFFYSGDLPRHTPTGVAELNRDIRDFSQADLRGFEAVIHLAALSNDPLGQLKPELTYAINHQASLRLAQMAKQAGVGRFLYASTCSVYGMADPSALATEEAPLRPITPYAVSKVRVEEDLDKLADGSFSPVYLRNATAYGWSPRFRADIVLNNLSCWAYTTGEIKIMSDGTPWRPLVHAEDIARAFATCLEAPRERIHNQAFNVGVHEENYQVRELAEIVQQVFPGSRVLYAEGGGPDPRSYRVDFSKIKRQLPEFQPAWNARRGAEQLKAAYQQTGLTQADFTGPKYVRLERLKLLLQAQRLDANLRWKERGSHQEI